MNIHKGHKNNTHAIYTCPMHPEVRQDHPGLCPECGMSLVPEKKTPSHGHKEEPKGYDKHAGHSTRMFLQKFWVSLILTVPVVLYSELPQRLFSWSVPRFPGSAYVQFLLGSIVFFYGGWVFLKGASTELRAKLPGMMTLIALAIVVAYLYSVFGALSGSGHTLFWELTTLITVMLLGHWLEMRAVQSAQGALRELSKLLPDRAEVIRDGTTVEVSLQELKVGDMVFVRPGSKVPADGKVAEGRSEVNESMITGESRPVLKEAQSEVIAGTLNGDGVLKVEVTKIGEHTFLAGVMRLVAEAQASKSRLQMLSDRAAFYLTVIAVLTGSVTFLAWMFAKAGAGFALERLVAVLVIACPHALGLAIPLVASISTTLAARNGFLVRRRLALELARNIDTVLFDKTGTLTKGHYGVTYIFAVAHHGENDVLTLAASVDSHSEHFVAKAIVQEAVSRGLALSEPKSFERLPGKGVRGMVQGVEVTVGGEAVLKESGVAVPREFQSNLRTLAREGQTLIFVQSAGEFVGVIALADVIREESREAVQSLKRMGLRPAMITGDSEGVARWVAEEVGLDEYFARVLPGEKAGKVKLLQSQGRKVAMVGDGINDAPALTQADLGIAVGAGTNVAIESAGIILVRNDPRDIPKIVELSRATYSKMLQNLFWATGYNIVALPLAAGVLASKGILLQPALSAVFMSLSTVIVAVNALFLRKKTL